MSDAITTTCAKVTLTPAPAGGFYVHLKSSRGPTVEVFFTAEELALIGAMFKNAAVAR